MLSYPSFSQYVQSELLKGFRCEEKREKYFKLNSQIFRRLHVEDRLRAIVSVEG
jgi:hypothetical protein